LRLKKLEEKYWQGETTLQEEGELRSAAQDSPDALSPEFVQIVVSLRNEGANSSSQLDGSFEAEFWAAVEQEEKPKIIRARFTPLEFVRYAAAAVVILCFGFGIWYAVEETQSGGLATSTQQREFESPEAAFEEAKKALSYASSKLNKAKKPVQKIEKFHQATLSVAGMNTVKTAKNATNENDE